jgi:hypothetical protein
MAGRFLENTACLPAEGSRSAQFYPSCHSLTARSFDLFFEEFRQSGDAQEVLSGAENAQVRHGADSPARPSWRGWDKRLAGHKYILKNFHSIGKKRLTGSHGISVCDFATIRGGKRSGGFFPPLVGSSPRNLVATFPVNNVRLTAALGRQA